MTGDTLTNLTARVYEAVGLPTTDGLITSSVVTSALNRALEKIATEKNWPWLQVTATTSTVAGTATLTPPAGWTRTEFLSIGATDLELRQRRDITRYLGSSLQGQPILYAVDADSLYLAPIPDAVYTVTHGYIRRETTLSSGSDTPYLPFEYSDIAVVGAGIHVADRLRDLQMKRMFQEEYKAWLDRIVDNVRRSAALGRIKRRRDWVI